MNLQDQLLFYSENKYTLSREVVAAYRSCPRHLFIKKPYSMEEMYADYPLEIYRDKDVYSTISQPSFTLLMLDLLDLKPGHKVIEVGAGSGWNAALMSRIVGETGKVVTLEIIPELANQTKENLKELGFGNIELITGDASQGYLPEAPYDRGVFTAGASDLPQSFHDQIKVGGKLLFVLKTLVTDYLLLLIKHEDHFESVLQIPCRFIPMQGSKKALASDEENFLVGGYQPLDIYKAPPGSERDSLFEF